MGFFQCHQYHVNLLMVNAVLNLIKILPFIHLRNIKSSSGENAKLGQRGRVKGSPDIFLEFWYPLYV